MYNIEDSIWCFCSIKYAYPLWIHFKDIFLKFSERRHYILRNLIFTLESNLPRWKFESWNSAQESKTFGRFLTLWNAFQEKGLIRTSPEYIRECWYGDDEDQRAPPIMISQVWTSDYRSVQPWTNCLKFHRFWFSSLGVIESMSGVGLGCRFQAIG